MQIKLVDTVKLLSDGPTYLGARPLLQSGYLGCFLCWAASMPALYCYSRLSEF
jgi:hypothetical protein